MPLPVKNQKQSTATPGRTKSVNMDARTVEHYVSTPSVDEQGEVLLPRGADITRFTKSPTVFDVHAYGSENVVGRNLKYDITDEGHVAITRFADRPASLPAGQEWRPDTLLHLYNTGDISGWSIGFNPQEWREPSKKDRDLYGEACNLVHTRYRVLEYSVAPLPCNEDALTRGLLKRGIISKRLAESLNAGKIPTAADLSPARKTIVVMTPSPAEPIAQRRKVFVVVSSPPEPPVKPKVNRERIAKNALAIARGKLYT